jgi:hypothetical protein
MKTGIRGDLLPESADDYEVLVRSPYGLRYTSCVRCKTPYGPNSASSPEGWRDTQIIGYCEPCFDALTDDCGAPPEDAVKGSEL